VTQGIDLSTPSHAEQDDLIRSLVGQVEPALARIAKFEKRLARFERPASAPDNSSLPPSKGQKPLPGILAVARWAPYSIRSAGGEQLRILLNRPASRASARTAAFVPATASVIVCPSMATAVRVHFIPAVRTAELVISVFPSLVFGNCRPP
jgi:hypothetical protein